VDDCRNDENARSAYRLGLLAAGWLFRGWPGKTLSLADSKQTSEACIEGEIDRFRCTDNHATPDMRTTATWDANGLAADESARSPAKTTSGILEGAKALFGYPYDDFKPEHANGSPDKKMAAENTASAVIFEAFLRQLMGYLPGPRAIMRAYLDTETVSLGVFWPNSFSYPFDNRDRRSTLLWGSTLLQEKMLARWKETGSVKRCRGSRRIRLSRVTKTTGDNPEARRVEINSRRIFPVCIHRSLSRRCRTKLTKNYRAGAAGSDEYRNFQD